MSTPKYIWMNGKMVETEQAQVPFLNTALHYGAAVFEGIRAYKTDHGAAIFRLPEHIDRLMNSAKIMGFECIPFTHDEIFQATIDIVAANELESCYIRPLIYACEPMSLNLDASNVGVGIAAWEMSGILGAAADRGARVNVSSFTRHHPNVNLTKCKASGNYTNSIYAKTESSRLGFDEAIMLDPSGLVAECTGENLFLVRGGKVYTTNAAEVLEGITRDTLIRLFADLGVTVCETALSRDQLYIADEMFMCGTGAEVVPVCEVDRRFIGNGSIGPLSAKIKQLYHDVVSGRESRYLDWLTFVK